MATMEYNIYNGDCLEVLDKLQSGSIDCVITDPPYELNFMNKGWDNAGVSFDKNTWAKCLRVLKPGGYLLAFGGTRTYHRIACAIEDAGFEIRDCIMWLYGSGFPKSMDIEKAVNKRDGVEFSSKPASGVGFMNTKDDGYHNTINQLEQVGDSSDRAKEWQGWGTALKPAYEPIIVARKPFKGSLVDNVLENGVGGLNIDECRVGNEEISVHNAPKGTFAGGEPERGSDINSYRNHTGRFPANLILTYGDNDANEVCGGFPNTKSQKRSAKYNKDTEYTNTYTPARSDYRDDNTYGDSGRASRYFYCAKANKKDRDEGLDEFEEKTSGQMTERKENSAGITAYTGSRSPKRNSHPTVKPTELMQYLVRLVAPKGATICDPFMGSGSTGKAIAYENQERGTGYKFIGIEQNKEYCDIAEARIKYVVGVE